MNLEALSGSGLACCVAGAGMLLLFGFYSIMSWKSGRKKHGGSEKGY